MKVTFTIDLSDTVSHEYESSMEVLKEWKTYRHLADHSWGAVLEDGRTVARSTSYLELLEYSKQKAYDDKLDKEIATL